MKKTMLLLTNSFVIFNPLALTSCNFFAKPTYVEQKLNLTNAEKDLDCDTSFFLEEKKKNIIKIDILKNGIPTRELKNKIWPNWNELQLISNNEYFFSNELKEKILRCSQQNLIKADQTSIDEFNKFRNDDNAFKNYDQVRIEVYRATKAKIDFDEIIAVYIMNQERKEQFKDTILLLYNVLAKLVGKETAVHLIFDLKIQRQLTENNKTLAVSIGFPDLAGNNGVTKSCIIYTYSSLNVDEIALRNNYYNQMFWTTDSFFHPFIHEFGHIIDYYLTMSPENRLRLKEGNSTSNNGKCEVMNNNNNFISNNDRKLNAIQKTNNNPFSIGADDLKKYLFANVRNHKLTQKSQMLDLLAYSVVRSDYATTMNPELFAEAFALWLVTDKEKRARNWQILNRFFATFLKKRIDCPYCTT